MTIERRHIAVIIAVCCLCSSGCSGCEDPILDRVEQWIRDHPERPGKVGTLVALRVGETARQNAVLRAAHRQDPCDIGWRLEEAMGLDFEVDIEARRGSWSRRWAERGTWTSDGDGRWEIRSEIDFEAGSQHQGQRVRRVFSDEQGFWEWLGPQVVVQHPPNGAAQHAWRREFEGRFAELMHLISRQWTQESQAQNQWVPGEQRVLCEARQPDRALKSWGAILNARATLDSARFIENDSEQNPDHLCREVKARYQLSQGGVMEVQLTECRRGIEARLVRPEFERVIQPGRDRSRHGAQVRVEQWIDEEIVIPIDGD